MAPKKPDQSKEIDPNPTPPETTMPPAEFSVEPESETAALDDIEVFEPGENPSADTAGPGDADPAMRHITVPDGAMPFDEWYQEAFVNAHLGVNFLLKTQSLAAAPQSPEGRRAALGLYRTCCRVPLLHFVLCPGPEWARDLSAIAVYAFFVGQGVAAELIDRKAAVAKAQDKPAAATAKPGGGGEHGFAADAA